MNSKGTSFNRTVFFWCFGISIAIGLWLANPLTASLGDYIKKLFLVIPISFLFSLVVGIHILIQGLVRKAWVWLLRRQARIYVKIRLQEYHSSIGILGIVNNDGTVNLILNAGSREGIFRGETLDICSEPGEEIYGESEVVRADNSKCFATPIDRIKPEFWGHLEDRMRYDPSAPDNVVAKRHIPEQVLTFIAELL